MRAQDNATVSAAVTAKQSLRSDFSVSAVVAGVITIMVGYSGPFVIVLAAARAAELSEAQTTSWVLAVSIGAGITSMGLSWRSRIPVLTAWSTPGAALLVTSIANYEYSDVIGTYIVVGVATALIGFSGIFGKIMNRVPPALSAAVLAGVLLPFVLNMFREIPQSPAIVLAVLVSYLLAKRVTPRYSVLVGLGVGFAVAAIQGSLTSDGIQLGVSSPVFTSPSFSASTLVGLGLPLLLILMGSQNAPGLMTLRSYGYEPNDRRILGFTGVVSALQAPFGGPGTNLSVITSAICASPEANPDPSRRYVASVTAGGLYLLVGIMGSSLVQLFAALPRPLVLAVGGVALLGPTLQGLVGALETESSREPALIAFAITISGVVIFSVSSAFWGLVGGAIAFTFMQGRFGLTSKRQSPSRRLLRREFKI